MDGLPMQMSSSAPLDGPAIAIRLAQLDDVPVYTAAITSRSTSICDKELSLENFLAALRTRHSNDVDAILLVKQAIEERYEQEERTVESALRLLRSQRNELAPVSRLPPEILSLVFRFLSDIDPPLLSIKRPGWPTVTHVCQRWRQTALAQCCLWSRIQFDMGERWVRASLARAGSAPLSLMLSLPGRRVFAWEVDVVKATIARAMHFKFRTSRFETADQEEKLLQTPAPMLEGLDARFETDGSLYSSLPATMFGGQVPKLQHLRFAGRLFPWHSPLLKALVTLDMSYVSTSRDHILQRHTFPLETIIAGLQNMQQLERLSFDLVLPLVHTPNDDCADLPSLKFLAINGTLGDIILFLQHTTVPPNTQVTLGLEPSQRYRRVVAQPVIANPVHNDNGLFTNDTPGDKELAAFLRTALSILCRHDASPLRTISKLFVSRGTGDKAALITGSNLPTCVRAYCGDTPLTSAPKLSISFKLAGHAYFWDTPFASATTVRALASAHLQELVIGDPSFDEVNWAALKSMRSLNLRRVEAWGGAAVSFLKLLLPPLQRDGLDIAPPSASSSTATGDVCFLPTVRSVSLRWASFRHLSFPEQDLPRRFARRAALGAPLQTLDIDAPLSIRISTLRGLRVACPKMALTGIEFKRWQEDADEEEEMGSEKSNVSMGGYSRDGDWNYYG
ncbi:hypothetical protein FA95DRAFT_1573857 [Auriscalpium vulgare]|uniref:Uncharacterized protein n=1 Tax=Auriscalpium vulgare TaxID=40419 RepID=A0ACB8RN31_9AGAM|nr:hypothetical protein FA95DRAFT_1573857 [Auriscalpium vulgare]